MLKRLNNTGFGPTSLLAVFVMVMVIAGAGLYISKHHHGKSEAPAGQPKISNSTAQTRTAATDTYAGWSTYCDTANAKACFKYPSDWVASRFGGFENPTQTAYVDYQGNDSKDQSSATVYVASISSVTDASLDLKIVGTIEDNIPGYAIYNGSDVASLAVGQNATIVTGNATFKANGDINNTFGATPDVTGLKAITNLQQAKAWFATPEAQQCLWVLESLYFN